MALVAAWACDFDDPSSLSCEGSNCEARREPREACDPLVDRSCCPHMNAGPRWDFAPLTGSAFNRLHVRAPRSSHLRQRMKASTERLEGCPCRGCLTRGAFIPRAVASYQRPCLEACGVRVRCLHMNAGSTGWGPCVGVGRLPMVVFHFDLAFNPWSLIGRSEYSRDPGAVPGASTRMHRRSKRWISSKRSHDPSRWKKIRSRVRSPYSWLPRISRRCILMGAK